MFVILYQVVSLPCTVTVQYVDMNAISQRSRISLPSSGQLHLFTIDKYGLNESNDTLWFPRLKFIDNVFMAYAGRDGETAEAR